jgi:hypothetical protein
VRSSRDGLVDFKFAKALSMEELILPEDHGSFYIRDRYKVRDYYYYYYCFVWGVFLRRIGFGIGLLSDLVSDLGVVFVGFGFGIGFVIYYWRAHFNSDLTL